MRWSAEKLDVDVVVGGLAGSKCALQKTMKPAVEPSGFGEQASVLGDDRAMARETQVLRQEQSFGHIKATVIHSRNREIRMSGLEERLRRVKGFAGLIEEGAGLFDGAQERSIPSLRAFMRNGFLALARIPTPGTWAT